jgi:hypothetical protein
MYKHVSRGLFLASVFSALLSLVLAPLSPLFAQAAPPSGVSMPVGDLSGWKQIFTEDFVTDVSLGNSNVFMSKYSNNFWQAYSDGDKDTAGKNDGKPSVYYPSKVMSVQNGKWINNVHTETINGVSRPLGSGIFAKVNKSDSQGARTYGKYTLRFRVVANNSTSLKGFKMAYLLWPKSQAWPRDGEIDFPEGDFAGSIFAANHRQGGTSGDDQDVFFSSTKFNDGNWHTTSIEWLPSRVTFLLDGVKLGEVTSRIPNTPMFWVLQNEACLGVPCPDPNANANVEVDWMVAYAPDSGATPPPVPTPTPTPVPPPAPVGTVVKPGDNIQNIINSKPAGTTYVFSPGVYRNVKLTPKNGDTYIGALGAVLNGSKVLSSWASYNSTVWVATGQSQDAGVGGGVQCQSGMTRCGYNNELFIDDVRQKHVDAISKVTAGTWYFDMGADKIYLGTNPAGKTVESSTVDYAFVTNGTNHNVTIQNLTIEKYANSTQRGVIRGRLDDGKTSTGWKVINNKLQNTHGPAITVFTDWVVSNNLVQKSGQVGINGGGARVKIENNEIAYNNEAGYNPAWDAGGSKFTRTQDWSFKGNYVHHNYGVGLWGDLENQRTTFDGNTLTYNDRSGIEYDLSFGATIKNNFAAYNGTKNSTGLSGSQIVIQNSKDALVETNTVIIGNDQTDGIGIVNQARGNADGNTSGIAAGTPRIAINNTVKNNKIYNLGELGTNSGASISTGTAPYDLSLGQRTNLFDYNTYYQKPNVASLKRWEFTTPAGSTKTWSEYRNDPNYPQERNGSIVSSGYTVPSVPAVTFTVGPVSVNVGL